MYKPFRFFGAFRSPSQGFYNDMNFLREVPIEAGLSEVEFVFGDAEMKEMYRPSLEIEVYDKEGDIEIQSVGVLGKKLIVRLTRRTGARAKIKAKWIQRYLYDS